MRASFLGHVSHTVLRLMLPLLIGCDGGGVVGPGKPVASVVIAPAAPVLMAGDSVQLTAIVRDQDNRPIPGRVVTWAAQPNVVLSVSSTGLVTGTAPGSATVTATSEGQRGTATVTVTSSADPVASITLDRTSATLVEGDRVQLAATLWYARGREIYGRAVEWAFSDETVASVQLDGVVTGIRAESVTITASAETKFASAAITVTADYSFDLIYSGSLEPAGTPRLLRLPMAGGDPQPILPSSVLPGWALVGAASSPDGARVAFSAQLGSEAYLYVVNADGSGLRQLTTEGDEGGPTWSPDGTEIAFESAPAGPDSDIWVMRADGSNPRNLTGALGFEYEYAPAWSPATSSSDRIAFAQSDFFTYSRIVTMRTDGSDLRYITAAADRFDGAPTWAPDGSRIVFTRESERWTNADLWIVDATGANARAFVALPSEQLNPSWSPDGRLLSFSSLHLPGPYQVYTVWADGTALVGRTDAPGGGAHPGWLLR